MLTIEEARKTLRITTTKLDEELQTRMDAAVRDLEKSGVYNIPEDSLIDEAIRLWLQWKYNYQGRGPEYERNYKELRSDLSMMYPKEENDQWTTSCT